MSECEYKSVIVFLATPSKQTGCPGGLLWRYARQIRPDCGGGAEGSSIPPGEKLTQIKHTHTPSQTNRVWNHKDLIRLLQKSG